MADSNAGLRGASAQRPLHLRLRGARNGLIAAAAVTGGLLLTSAPAGAFSSAPLWQCRGSALYASVAGNNRVEPEVANGSPNTGNGGNPDRAQCVNSEVGANNLATPLGLPANFLSAPTASATTSITPEIGPSITQKISATGHVENLQLQLPAGATVALGVAVANANVTGSCVNGAPKLVGTSQATGITLGGNTITLDDLVTGIGNLLHSLGLDPIVTVKVNEQIATPTSLTVRALHITIVNAADQSPLVDVIVAEAKGAFDKDVCNPADQFNIPPGIMGNGGNTTVVNGTNGTDHNGNIGSANGPKATCGHLTMYFDRNKKHTLTSIYGTRQVTRGRIISCGAHPKSIVGAKIDVIHVINGKRHLVKTGLKSRTGGKLTLILPLNLTSRNIEYEYRGRLDSPKVTSKVTLGLTVKTKSGKKL